MTKSKQQKNAILTIVCLLVLAVFGAAMVWLHYQQLCSPGGGDDPYTSDLGQHLYFAQQGMIYSTVSLLIGPAYDIAGRIGIAVLLAVFHLAAVAVFAWGLRAAGKYPPGTAARQPCGQSGHGGLDAPGRLLVSGHGGRYDLP